MKKVLYAIRDLVYADSPEELDAVLLANPILLTQDAIDMMEDIVESLGEDFSEEWGKIWHERLEFLNNKIKKPPQIQKNSDGFSG